MPVESKITINMPQMAIGALSENWLFKELGSRHWDMICEGLGTRSFDLKDDLDNRLYATFIRIRIHCSVPLVHFGENEELAILGEISRYGHSLYQSNIRLMSPEKVITAELLTSFSVRNDSDNNKLVKSQPAGVANSVPESDTMPVFADEYRLVKKGVLDSLKHPEQEYAIEDTCLFETVYQINAYYDLNGVGLLYFASYPAINDYCEAQFFNRELKAETRWEQTYYTSLRDVLYFANCNLEDEVVYRMHSYEKLGDDRIKIAGSLWRRSDNVLMARIFSVKTRCL